MLERRSLYAIALNLIKHDIITHRPQNLDICNNNIATNGMFKECVTNAATHMKHYTKLFGRFDVAPEPFKMESKKVLVYYLGAGFCPWCAAERWSIIEALKHFGTWGTLKPDKSADKNEPFLNLPTYNFSGVKFESDVVEFVGKEFQDRNFQDVDHFTDSDNAIIDNYNLQGVIPFTFIGGKFVRIGSGPKPEQFVGLTHDDVKKQLENKDTSLAKAIEEEANYIAALIYHSLLGKVEVPVHIKEIASQIK
jgi:hypothetical protein